MAQACAIAKYGEVDEKTEDEIKGMAAGTENYGNFFAQNCFMGSSGTLLIVSTFGLKSTIPTVAFFIMNLYISNLFAQFQLLF